MRFLIASVFLLQLVHGPAQVLAGVETPGLASQPATHGASLKYFGSIDDGVFKGSRPKSDADYHFLQSLHIKYIVDIQTFSLLTHFEKEKAKRYGITVIPGIMNASPFSPSEKHVDRILSILRDAHYHPVYFHCNSAAIEQALLPRSIKCTFWGCRRRKRCNICMKPVMALSMAGCGAV